MILARSILSLASQVCGPTLELLLGRMTLGWSAILKDAKLRNVAIISIVISLVIALTVVFLINSLGYAPSSYYYHGGGKGKQAAARRSGGSSQKEFYARVIFS